MNYIERAVSDWGVSNEKRWKFCVSASRVVGREDGSTAVVAKRIGCSDDTVERHAHAWWAYRCFYRYAAEGAKRLRCELTYTHFSVAWTAISRKEDPVPVPVAYEMMMACIEDQNNKKTVRQLAGELAEGNPLPMLSTAQRRVLKSVDTLEKVAWDEYEKNRTEDKLEYARKVQRWRREMP